MDYNNQHADLMIWILELILKCLEFKAVCFCKALGVLRNWQAYIKSSTLRDKHVNIYKGSLPCVFVVRRFLPVTFWLKNESEIIFSR